MPAEFGAGSGELEVQIDRGADIRTSSTLYPAENVQIILSGDIVPSVIADS